MKTMSYWDSRHGGTDNWDLEFIVHTDRDPQMNFKSIKNICRLFIKIQYII